MDSPRIKLLVSPRNIEEALEVINSNSADYLDCKNPAEGSLGANSPSMIRDMKEIIPKGNRIKLSATIGDFPNLPGSAALAALGAAYSGADIVKVGLMGPKNKEDSIALMSSVVKAVKDYDEDVMVVAAGYADQERLESSPSPLDIPEIAAKSGCDVAMVDTAIKDGKSLFDFLDVVSLVEFKNKGKENNLLVALAGNLQLEDIEKIKEIKPDIIGVRSIVCTNGDRNNGIIKKELIQKLAKIID